MVCSAFLPVAVHNNKLFFLFGRELDNDSAPGFSDFGGKVNNGENIYKAGIREFTEETTGLFGNEADVEHLINRNGGVHKLRPMNTYNIRVVRIDYCPQMITFFNNTHKFIHSNVKDAKSLKKTCIFEKVEIAFMTREEALARRNEFRHFYREILDKIMGEELPGIKKFITSRPSFRIKRRRQTNRHSTIAKKLTRRKY
jgi:hypothetical protein